jgi:hypothetical protein
MQYCIPFKIRGAFENFQKHKRPIFRLRPIDLLKKGIKNSLDSFFKYK